MNEWKTAIGFDAPRELSPTDVTRLGRLLEPKSAVAMDGSLRRLAGYVNLELQTPKAERFHRVYKGAHPARRDRVVLHLYDLSVSDDKNAEAKARREFEALHRLQIHGWAPRILDSYQDVPATREKCTSLPLSILRPLALRTARRTQPGALKVVLRSRGMPRERYVICTPPAPRTSLSC